MDIQYKNRQIIHQNIKWGWEQNGSIGMQSNFSCYQLKIDYYIYKMFYISLMVTTKQKPTADKQKTKIRELRHASTGNHQFTKEDIKRGIKNRG